jgi:type IX secretion system PorP/SprF family membrane protein
MKNILCLIVIAFVLLLGTDLSAQVRLHSERGIFTQANEHPILINPGYTGFRGNHELLVNYRNTWASFPGAPSTFTFSYDGAIGNRIGIGAQLLSDRYASFETLKGLVSVSYGIKSETNDVRAGLSLEYLQHQISASDASSILVAQNDLEILDRLNGSQFFDVSFGVYGEYMDKIIYGLTLPSLVSAMLNDFESGTTGAKEFGAIVHLGYRHRMPEYDLVLEPSVVYKYLMLTPTHADINLKAKFLDESLTGGLTYSVGGENRFGFLAGVNIEDFGFFYSYNISFNDFQQFNNGSHELSFTYTIDKIQKDTVISK